MHITGIGDYSINSSTINGWLRNFLWSQAAQVIQSYGTNLSGYGFIFIRAHFLWAFSWMASSWHMVDLVLLHQWLLKTSIPYLLIFIYCPITLVSVLGQRELIVGDRQIGKTSLGVDVILNQAIIDRYLSSTKQLFKEWPIFCIE